MAKALKTLLKTGLYVAPQGSLRATPARMRRWTEQFRAMREEGIKVPVGWGHAPTALPGDPDQRAKQQFWLSAYNAGTLDSLDLTDKGELKGALDCPGVDLDDKGNLVAWRRLADGSEVRTAISEVSIALKDWRDGKGKLWKDCITHVALTPLPVYAGQDGFAAALSTAHTDSGFTLSLAGFTRELSASETNMADEKEKDAIDATAEAEEEEVAEDTPPPPPAEPARPAADNGARLSECIRVLEAHGLHLPGDTTMENLAERICVAGHAKAKGVAEDEEGDEMDEEDGEPAEYSGENGGQTVEEQRPVMLSLATARNPVEKASIRREQDAHKARQLRLIKRLEKKGLPPHKAADFRSRVEGYTLSLTEEGEIVSKKLDLELSTWSEALAGSHFAGTVLGRARPEPRPGPDPKASQKTQEEAGDALAELAGAPARRK